MLFDHKVERKVTPPVRGGSAGGVERKMGRMMGRFKRMLEDLISGLRLDAQFAQVQFFIPLKNIYNGTY